jgi:phosphoserine/homoserine phosphotransferase
MNIVCSDLEGIFTPEIWINVAEKTGIAELRLTTRDISDYDVLMRKRLSILNENGLKLKDITDVIAGMDPLAGALDFLNWLRAKAPVIVVSDTYEEFAKPLMQKLGWPTLFCHNLTIAADGAIVAYNLRQKNSKYEAVLALKRLNYRVFAIGDSYNDIAMLKEAHKGFLFRPPDNVKEAFRQFPVSSSYAELKQKLDKVLRVGLRE